MLLKIVIKRNKKFMNSKLPNPPQLVYFLGRDVIQPSQSNLVFWAINTRTLSAAGQSYLCQQSKHS